MSYSIVAVKGAGMNWRVQEWEMLQEQFGPALEVDAEDVTAERILENGAKYIFWAPHTEGTGEDLWEKLCRIADEVPVEHINDPRHWLACHAKEVAFNIWRRQDIRCPDWFEFQDIAEFSRQDESLGYPLLMRLNNAAGGVCSYLVRTRKEIAHAWGKLYADRDYCCDGHSMGTRRKFIAVKYIPATLDERVTMSFRIIVAGDEVIAGYARIGPLSDWVAITNRFEPQMEELFVEAQKRCRIFCLAHQHEIVRSVQCLGLNFQGVDVILDRDGFPYYLEVQPWFSTGYATSRPPYYNPSQEALVKFLSDNEKSLRQEIPWYYERWLDKQAMFRESFAAIKRGMDA